MKLHTYFRSSCSFRVRIALHYKGLPWDDAFVHLRRGDQRAAAFLARNPQGLVPTLEDEGLVISQSLAILEYLEERYPDPPLLPGGAGARARVRQLACAVACDIQPLQNLSVTQALQRDFGLGEADTARWVGSVIERGLAAVEGILSQPGTGTCCHGDAPTLADVCLVPQVWNARRFGCDLSNLPLVQRVDRHCAALAAFRAAAPDAQPDAQ